MKVDQQAPWDITMLCYHKGKIDLQPEYQREQVWNKKQKQLLMDTIIRGFDMPKIYLSEVERDDGVEYEVADGQQRINAIFEFYNNEYPLAKGMKPVDGIECEEMNYKDLGKTLRKKFDKFRISVSMISDATEAEVCEMFLRLQSGTSLNAQEKRNARIGGLRNFVNKCSEHSFFEKCTFRKARFSCAHVAAQMLLLELKDGPTTISKNPLDSIYETEFQKEFDPNGAKAKKVSKVLNFLDQVFPDKEGHLGKIYNVIALYCLASDMLDNFAYQGHASDLRSWFIDFQNEVNEDAQKDEEKQDIRLVDYRGRVGNASDNEENIRWRLKFMQERFYRAFPNIKPKDTNRGFSYGQRLAIYYRDDGKCQIKMKCDGKKKLDWEGGWHADHEIPHSAGGTTTVSNGRVACPECNQAKGASLRPT